jgi:flagellar biosynthesis/type III secretory pathway protein FliH
MGLVVLTERPEWQLACESKVLEPVEVMAIEKASELMHSVETYATRVLRSALKVYDQRASEGFKTGEERAEASVAERLFALEAARSSLIELLRPSLTDLLLDAMHKLARGIPRERLYASAVASIDEAWRQARWARMHVNPRDMAAAEQALADLAAEGHRTTSITVVADNSVPAAGCRFESDLGFADAGLEVQLQALRNAFSEGLQAWGEGMAVDEEATASETAA